MSSCKSSGVYLNLTINILIHMIILFSILSILFWTFISEISSKALTKQVNININNAIDNETKKLSEKDRIVLKDYISSHKSLLDILEKQYSKPDSLLIKNNNWLKVFNITSLAILIISLTILLTVLSLSCSMCVPILHILGENILLFALVGVVEFIFFKEIAMKYVPETPSRIISSFIDRINSNLNLKN
jgi:hypothetical protein